MQDKKLPKLQEKLKEMNGKYVWIKDFDNGSVAGKLVYVSGSQKYLIDSVSKGSLRLNLCDLEQIFD